MKHERKAGSIWQKEEPFTKKQEAHFNSLTWIINFSGDKNRLNKDFQSKVNSKKNKILDSLQIEKIEDAPEDVQNAYDRYRKEAYNKVLSRLREHQTAPPMAVTGASNYKGNFDKRERIERRARENYKKINKTVDIIIKRYANLNLKSILKAKQKQQVKKEKIDFIKEKLNNEIAKIRKKYKSNLNSIIKAYGGTQDGYKDICYRFELKKNKFDLELSERGGFYLHSFNSYKNRDEKTFSSVIEMINELENFLIGDDK